MAYEKKKVKKLPIKGVDTSSARKKNIEYYENNIEKAKIKQSSVIKMSPKKSSEIKSKNADLPPKEEIPKRKTHKPLGLYQNEKTQQPHKEKRPLTVIDGGKTKRRRANISFIRTTVIAGILVALIVALNAYIPSGLMEYSQNLFSSIGGGGGYPIEISGSKVDNLYSRKSLLFAMTDTSTYVYNSSGKEVTSYQHGYSNPVFVKSDTRTLTYDRGNTEIRVDTLYTNLLNKKLDSAIITANICDNGAIAVVQNANGYAAQMTVYNKSFEQIYRWSSAENQISCVSLSNNGKKVAVATINVQNGKYVSTINIFELKTGKNISTLNFDGALIVSLENKKDRIVAFSNNIVSSFDWSGENRVDKRFDYITAVDKQYDGKVLVIENPNNDSNQSKITVLDSKLNDLMSINVKSTVKSACVGSGGIYCLANNKLFHYNSLGEKKDEWDIGYEYIHLSPYKGGAAVTSDMSIEVYK